MDAMDVVQIYKSYFFTGQHVLIIYQMTINHIILFCITKYFYYKIKSY